MNKVLDYLEESAKLAKLAIYEKDDESLINHSVRLLALGMVMGDIGSGVREDDDEEGEEGGGGAKVNHGNTKLPYGLCKSQGINTQGMTPRDAWEALAGKGISAKEEYAKLKKQGASKIDLAPMKSIRSERKKKAAKTYESLRRELDVGHGLSMASDFYKEIKEKALAKYGSKEELERRIQENKDKIQTINDEIKGMEDDLMKSAKGDYSDEFAEEINKKFKKLYDDRTILEWKNQRYEEDMENINRGELAEKGIVGIKQLAKDEIKADESYYKQIKKKFPTVDDCQTIEDLNDYAMAIGAFDGIDKTESELKHRISDSDPIDLSGCDFETAKGVVKNLENMCDKVPAYKEILTAIKVAKRGDGFSKHWFAASYPEDGRILLSPKWYSNPEEYKKVYEKSLEKKYDSNGKYVGVSRGEYSYHPQGTTIDGTIIHEASHSLGNWISEKMTGKSGDRLMEHETFEKEVEKAAKAKFGINQKDLWKSVSKYAKKNCYEWYAEAMTVYVEGDSDNAMANFVGEYTKNKLKEMGY